MDSEVLNSLNATEVSIVSQALLLWLRTCPDIPNDVSLAYQYLDADKSCMSLHTLSGAVKREEYVDGGYEGYYPFAIYYRNSPDSNNSRIATNNVLDSIGVWLESQDSYPELDDNREISSVRQVTNSTLVKRFPNGYEDCMAKFELLFERS